MRFVFDGSNVVDRDGKGTILEIEPMTLTFTGMPVQLTIGRTAYLPPPTGFTASADVATLWHRFLDFREGREPLASMAYFCFTLITARGRPGKGSALARAAAMYAIHSAVLRKLSVLTSIRGDGATGRKFLGTPRPLTPRESAWVEEVVRALIRRVGEHAAGAALRPIAMTDFVNLDP
jgi:hypothetical protein